MIGLREDPAGGISPAHLACANQTAQAFAPGGWLQARLGLEHRPEQEQMSLEVAGAMLDEATLLFEAGTGVGKSMAYLIPGVMHAVDTGRPLIVSTNTIALQEQIENKDLPQCRQLFETVDELERYSRFRSTVLVGKANYLCRQRLSQALQNKTDLFGGPEQDELVRLAGWAARTSTGLIQELNPQPPFEVWDWVNADSSACSRRHCTPDTCFYQAARARIRRSQVIIVNHSLLFALINAGGLQPGVRGVLLPEDLVVIDEAHTMPDVATEHFGLRVSSYSVDRVLKGLYNPRRKTGLIRKLGNDRDRQRVVDAIDAATVFFEFIGERLLSKQTITRVREPGFAEPTLLDPLRRVADSLDRIGGMLDEGWMKDDLKDNKARLTSIHDHVRAFLDMTQEEHVHWVERTGRRGRVIALRTAPIDVAPHLEEAVFNRGVPIVCTSATLAVAGQIEPFQKRAGAHRARTGVVASPFDFERNMRVFVAADMPMPSPDNARLALEALADWLRFCVLRVPGGSLILFTSHHDLRRAAEALADAFEQAGRPVLVQGRGFSRSEIADRFRQAGNGVLFGTDSFWTGIDIPGPALSQVIITRLPFEVPTHPIPEARAEWIRARGGNPFAELNLPEAMVKFRQGIGRLIRRKDDRGLITILDSRILHKSYGRQFLQCLPTPRFTRLTAETRERGFLPFE